MQKSKSRFNIYLISLIGVMSAVVFIVNFISIPIPIVVGDVSRIHLGNAFCILAGLLFGPVSGGLAAGIGSALYDLTNPAYASEFYVTFLFKFVLGAVAGLIARGGKRKAANWKLNLTGAITGSVAYIILYLSKHYIQNFYLLGNTQQAVLASLVTKAITSLVNAVIAVVISMVLLPAFQLALKQVSPLKRADKSTDNT